MHWYTGRKIYFEHNMLVAFMKNEDENFTKKVEELIREEKKKKKYVFPYSPAHIEEVAVIFQKCKDRDKAQKYVAEHLDLISRISSNIEFLPNESMTNLASRIIPEHPNICMRRVLDEYNKTLWCEKNEEFLMSCRTRQSYDEFCKENPEWSHYVDGETTNDELQLLAKITDLKTLSKIPPEGIFELPEIKVVVNNRLEWTNRHNGYETLQNVLSIDKIPRYGIIKDNHLMKQDIVNFLIKSLHSAGYNSEHRTKSRSFMHDITHAIYAIQSDYFINNDEASRKKIKAVYSFLGVPCKVLSKQEFLDYSFNKQR